MSLRDTIAILEQTQQLLHIRKPVDPVYELSAIAKKLDGGPAVLFHDVRGYRMPVIVGTDGTREKIARNLGVDQAGLTLHYINAIEKPIPCARVETGPVKEVVHTGDIDIARLLPVPKHYEKEPGPYITSGLVLAKDPQMGRQNVSFHRFQVKAGNRLGVLIQPRHMLRIQQQAEQSGGRMELAIVVGTDIALRLAGATWGASIPLGLDELTIAGGLRGRAVEVVRAETVDLLVPADAEIVLEGTIIPAFVEDEGPMAEFTGVYGGRWNNPVVEISAITHRRDAIYQDILPFSEEHRLLLGMPNEPVLLKSVAGIIPGVNAVYITPGACGKFHAVISITKRTDGEAKNALLAALTSNRDIKQVIAVDPDIDIFRPQEVEYAVSTRVQWDRDVFYISGCQGNELDPMQDTYGYITKVGIDATKPLARAERFELATIPGWQDIRVEDYL
ncbi:MAG: UbiD family decarboxylase [Chloroflexi bacterium]|nr:UbiD family decarboxylase [Chloroflexota bacterium]